LDPTTAAYRKKCALPESGGCLQKFSSTLKAKEAEKPLQIFHFLGLNKNGQLATKLFKPFTTTPDRPTF
jgi:hypothetical protein